MILTSDLHIHTHCSCDSACAQIRDILEGGKAAGMKHLGISDHLHFLMEQYAKWREMGVKFSHGTDLHGAKYRGDWVLAMNALLTEYGFTAADFDVPRKLK